MYYTTGGFTLDDTVMPDGTVQWSAPGGNALYSAIGAKFWVDRVGIISPVGFDYPQAYLDQLQGAGFNLDGVRRIEHPSFHVWILHEGGGRRQIIYRLDSGKNEKLDPTPQDLPAGIEHARGVHVCPILGTSQARLVEFLLEKSVPTTLDLIVIKQQIDVAHGHKRQLWKGLRALLPSIEEVQALFGNLTLGELIGRLGGLSPGIFAIKLGQHGSVVRLPQSGEIYHVPACPVQVVDATGAGDSFCGGFLAGLQEAGDPIEAALCGTVSASFMIEGFGALHALATTKQQIQTRLEALRPQVRLLESSALSARLHQPWR